MKKSEQKTAQKGAWKFSSRPVMLYLAALCVLIVIAVVAGGLFFAASQMCRETEQAARQIQMQIDYRLTQSLKLLDSLAAQERYYDPEVSVQQKVKELEDVNSRFGYMMIRYVDAEINVYSGKGATSLASRDYLRRLFATGQPQVTDSFLAGADGKTLNYTVAVPLVDNGKITGALFCAIYFDELVETMKEQTRPIGLDAILLGSQQQVMSATDNLNYGDLFTDLLQETRLVGTNSTEVEADLMNREPDSFWSRMGGQFYYLTTQPVESTLWNVVCFSNLWGVYKTLLPNLLPIIIACILLFCAVMALTNYYMRSQLKVVDQLVQSVQELEHRIYQDDRPEHANFNDIIHLTSTGLSDGLTGVATRTVFTNQLKTMLKKVPESKLAVLCFVDLDDLKKLNDTHGHETGDVGLKSVGYVLREYEKKYDGLVGRYGGDEFVLLLTDVDTDEELREVLGELVLRLQPTIMHEGTPIQIKCSVGVSVWDKTSDTETLIKQADEALYFVKQNGKSYYKIYQDEM